MNQIYCTCFPVEPPVPSCVKAELVEKGLKIEIEAIALA